MRQKNFVKTIVWIIFIELLLFMAMLSLPSPWLLMAGMIIHIGLSIWAGLILHWLAQNGAIEAWVEYIYWLLFLVGVAPVQWFVALHQTMRARYSPAHSTQSAAPPPQRLTIETAPQRKINAPTEAEPGPHPGAPKARWPAVAALLMVLLAGLLNLVVAMMSTAEFRGLAMLYLHALVLTPLLLIIPGLLRLPAAASVKPLVVVCQALVYLLLATSWMIFLGR